jgi:chaperonin cofactor prefoldin
VKEKETQIEKLEKQNAALAESVTELKALVNELLQKANGGGE